MHLTLRPFLRSAAASALLAIGSFPSSAQIPNQIVAFFAANDTPPAQSSSSIRAPESRVSPELTRALRDAERHFQAGKALAIEGRAAESRAEFDAALDVLFAVDESTEDRYLAERKFEELIRRIHRYDTENLGSGSSPDSPVFVPSPLPEILDLTFPVDPASKNRALDQVRALKSQLPLTVNEAVLSYINYFSSPRGQKVLLYGLRRAGRYRPMIQRILDEEGVPQELIHLAQAESAFMPQAVSRKAATGMWQFVQWRGNQYGLRQTSFQDDRLEPEKATRAAARHLRDLYDQFGNWYLAMAAYNCGPGCVDRAIQRTGYADYWELRRRSALPRETSNYVPAIVAMAIVSKDLAAYGIPQPDADPELEYDLVRINANTSISLIADASDRPAADLRELNPFLLRSVAPAGSDVKVPKGSGPLVQAALDSIPAERRASWRLHRVENGDTLAGIAKRYATPQNSIIEVNRIQASFFDASQTGEVLLIPTKEHAEPAVKATQRSKTVLALSKSRSTRAAARPSKSARPAPRVASLASRQRHYNR